MPPTMTVRDVLALTRQHKISGLPVVANGKSWSASLPIAILRFETNLDQEVGAIMTPRERLITVKEGDIGRGGQGADAQASPRARAGGQ